MEGWRGGGAECETIARGGSEGTREELALAVLNTEPEGGRSCPARYRQAGLSAERERKRDETMNPHYYGCKASESVQAFF